MRDLAAEHIDEHGPAVFNTALRASAEHVCDGGHESAYFWYALSLLLDDIIHARVDPDRPLVLR